MELPHGVEMKHGQGKTHILKLLKNLYGQKHPGQVCNQHLHAKLTSIGFKQSTYDDCLYYRGTTIFAENVDNGIFTSANDDDTTKGIRDLKKIGCNIEDQGEMSDYPRVNKKQR